MTDPNRWQPLQLENMISQNGIPVENGVQQAVGPHWGYVKGFAVPDAGDAGTPFDPGSPPRLGDPVTDQAYKDQAVEVIRDSSQLDAADGLLIDISPGALEASVMTSINPGTKGRPAGSYAGASGSVDWPLPPM